MSSAARLERFGQGPETTDSYAYVAVTHPAGRDLYDGDSTKRQHKQRYGMQLDIVDGGHMALVQNRIRQGISLKTREIAVVGRRND